MVGEGGGCIFMWERWRGGGREEDDVEGICDEGVFEWEVIVGGVEGDIKDDGF